MAMYVILVITFARTLIAGRQPLCTHDQVTRLAACVVAPGLDAPHLLATLRQQIDPVFLPRNSTGKLPRAALQALLRVHNKCKFV
jgi:hypothetical protein